MLPFKPTFSSDMPPQERFVESASVGVETSFFTDLCGGAKQWAEIYQEVY